MNAPLLRLFALSLLLLSPATVPQDHPLAGAGKVSYFFRIAENEVGREEVTFRADGWDVEGHYDLGRRIDYVGAWTRTGVGTGTWYIEGNAGSTPGSITCEWDHESIAIQPNANGEDLPGSSADWKKGTAPIFFENLVWTVYSEIAARLLSGEGELEDLVGTKVALFQPQAAASFDVELLGIAARRWSPVPTADPLDLCDLEISVAGTAMFMTCTADGLLIQLTVPTQKLDVMREGFEGAALIVEPTSIVDSGPWRKQLSAPEHEVQSESNVRIPMRDGVELAADVHRPAGDGPWPTILVRTPYGRTNEGTAKGAVYARRGYALVAQDVRGRFDSDGEWFPLVNEERDGSDTLDWLAAQEWCDGNIGMIGGSYVGWVQWYAAASGNPHLKAIVPQVAPPDPCENIPYEGGAFLLGAAWWATVLDHLAKGGAGLVPDLDFPKKLATLPLTDLDQALGFEHPFLDEWLAHPPSDAEYWNAVSYQDRLPEMDVAALHVTGWYDGDQPGSLQNFPVMRARAASARARNGQFLVVGPWGHAFNATRKLGDVDFGPEAVVDLQAVYVRFFDRYLKGVQNGIEDEDPVLVFVMGENEWKREQSWPLLSTEFTPLHLASDGDARERDGDGRLALEAGTGAPSDSFVYDPARLPEMPQLDYSDVLGNAATMDLSGLADRDDSLEYTTPPFAAPVEITGPVEVVLWVATDAADTDVCASLLRVDPDGTARIGASGIQRLRYRNGPGTDAPVDPGEPVRVRIDCWATSFRIEKGQRLRLELYSSGFPGYSRNLNTLAGADSTEMVVATNRILHDAEHPSHLLLPVIPRKGAAGIVFEER